MTTFEKIQRKTGRKLISCKCEQCKNQCRHTPCIGTPEDIEKIMEAGFSDKLAVTDWAVGMVMGKTKEPIYMIQALATEQGCVFLEDGLCILHDLGLKPTEGKLSHHSTKLDNFKFGKSISWNVAKEWVDSENYDLVRRVFSRFLNESLEQ